MKKILTLLLFFAAPSFADSPVLEVSIVSDWETVSYYGSIEEVESAISFVFDYAEVILLDQLGIETEITYVDIPETEVEDTIANHTHASFLAESLITYRNENANHYNADVTVLITKRDLTIGSRNITGFAMTRRMCTASSIAIVELTDNGLDGQTLAHELVHVLGAVHDGTEPCENISTRGYLMAPLIHNGSDFLSQCSIDTINSAIDIYGSCLFEDNTTPVELQPFGGSSGGGGSMGILALQVLFTFILFKMWLNLCWAGAFGIRANTPDRDVVKYMAKFWGLIVIMIIMVYHVIKTVIGLV